MRGWTHFSGFRPNYKYATANAAYIVCVFGELRPSSNAKKGFFEKGHTSRTSRDGQIIRATAQPKKEPNGPDIRLFYTAWCVRSPCLFVHN